MNPLVALPSRLVKKVSCFDDCVVKGVRKLPERSSSMVTMVVKYFVRLFRFRIMTSLSWPRNLLVAYRYHSLGIHKHVDPEALKVPTTITRVGSYCSGTNFRVNSSMTFKKGGSVN